MFSAPGSDLLSVLSGFPFVGALRLEHAVLGLLVHRYEQLEHAQRCVVRHGEGSACRFAWHYFTLLASSSSRL
jgi:hypothetical protein